MANTTVPHSTTHPPEMDPWLGIGSRRYHSNAGSHRSRVKLGDDTRVPGEADDYVGYGLSGPRPGGVWRPISRYPDTRSRTPSELRSQRTSTGGSRPSLDLAEVEADASLDDGLDILDLNIDGFFHHSRKEASNHDYSSSPAGTVSQPTEDRHATVDKSLPLEGMLDAMGGATAHASTVPRRPPRKKTKSRLPEVDFSSLACEENDVHAQDGSGRFLWAAIVKGNLDVVRGVFKKKSALSYVDNYGNTALHLAARTGQTAILKWLLRCSNIGVSVRNNRGETCCHVAAKHGHVDCLRHVIFCGSMRPQSVATDSDHQGLTPAHLAAIFGHSQIVRWMVNTFGAPIGTIRNHLGQTPLHFAAAKGCLKSTEALGRLGEEAINTKDEVGCTPVYYACQEGQVLTLRHLVDVAGASVSIATNEGLTPLHAAAQTGRLDIVHFLLQRGRGEADLTYQTKDGATVFHMAAANGRADTLALLLTNAGADYAMRLRDIKGSSCAHDAAENGHVDCLKLLFAAGLNMYQIDEDGETPCTLASRSSNSACAAFGEELMRRRPEVPSSDIISSNRATNSDADSLVGEFQDWDGDQLIRLIEQQTARSQHSKPDATTFIREDSMRSKERRSLFRRLKDKFDEEKRLQEAYDQKMKVLKREFILRAMVNTGKQEQIASRKMRRPAPAAPVDKGHRAQFQKQCGVDVIREKTAEGFLHSKMHHMKHGLTLQRTDKVPLGTTRSLRIMASQVRDETAIDDDQLMKLLTNPYQSKHRAEASEEIYAPIAQFALPGTQSLNPTNHESVERQDFLTTHPAQNTVTTQTYASVEEIIQKADEMKASRQKPREIITSKSPPSFSDQKVLHAGKIFQSEVEEADDYQQRDATPTHPTIDGTNSQKVSPKRVPVKRGPKLKKLVDYRPLKDKVSLEFESIPEVESNASSFEKHSNHSSFEVYIPESVSDRNMGHNESTGYRSLSDYLPPPASFQDEAKPEKKEPETQQDMPMGFSYNLEPPDIHHSYISDILSEEDITHDNQLLDPSTNGGKRERPSNMPISKVTEEDTQKKIHPRINLLRNILEDSGIMTAYVNLMRGRLPSKETPTIRQQHNPHNEDCGETTALPQSSIHPPPPPPPPISSVQTSTTSVVPQVDEGCTSPSPNSSQTSGYISPGMRTPPSHDALSQQRKPSEATHVVSSVEAEEDSQNSSARKTGSAQIPWNVSLRRPPPKGTVSNPMSELERFFKLRKERTS